MKIHKEWIPYWLQHTHEWRPTTKMPQFRLQPDEVQAVAAFILAIGAHRAGAAQAGAGNAAHGKELLESRRLPRLPFGWGRPQHRGRPPFRRESQPRGEKDNYDYLVRWVHNPRERTRPYSPYEKRDLGPRDYAKHGLPFVFDLEHSRSPNDGHELVVQSPRHAQPAPERRRFARHPSYLITLKHPKRTSIPPISWRIPSQDKGKSLCSFYGCAGCTKSPASRTKAASAPSSPTKQQTHRAPRFRSLHRRRQARPSSPMARGRSAVLVRPEGLLRAQSWPIRRSTTPANTSQSAKDRLRMPKPNVNGEDIDALTTMLLGSTDPSLPPRLHVQAFRRPRRHPERLVGLSPKYNCMGCHQIDIGQRSCSWDCPCIRAKTRSNLPPVLTSEGARVIRMLKNFRANPRSAPPYGTRWRACYLRCACPRSSFGRRDRTLMLFFRLSASGRALHSAEVEPLTTSERAMARALFTSTAAPA